MEWITAEIITIGDEILYGQILDTNSKWIAEKLGLYGIKVKEIITVADDKTQFLRTLEESIQRTDVILLTGGLGPTKDDITKIALAEFTNDQLEINQIAEKHVKAIFERRGLPFTEANRQQAAIPKNCTYLHNEKGTAPGMWFEYNDKIIVSMPGVPHEMKYLMEAEVLPRLEERFDTAEIHHRFIRTIGIGESFLAGKIADWEDNLPENFRLAYLPHIGEVTLRLTAYGANVDKELDQRIENLTPLIQKYVYAQEDIEIEEVVARLLLDENSKLSSAESCTGGNISHKITKMAGSSAYFLGTVVSYANSAKLNILKVKSETLSNFGAVSEETVTEMALGVRELTGSDYAVATSGIAGPSGGTPQKPVGTIWIAATNGRKTKTQKLMLGKDRLTNIEHSSKAALNLLRMQILKKWQ